jgi:hypothetical protein
MCLPIRCLETGSIKPFFCHCLRICCKRYLATAAVYRFTALEWLYTPQHLDMSTSPTLMFPSRLLLINNRFIGCCTVSMLRSANFVNEEVIWRSASWRNGHRVTVISVSHSQLDVTYWNLTKWLEIKAELRCKNWIFITVVTRACCLANSWRVPVPPWLQQP